MRRKRGRGGRSSARGKIVLGDGIVGLLLQPGAEHRGRLACAALERMREADELQRVAIGGIEGGGDQAADCGLVVMLGREHQQGDVVPCVRIGGVALTFSR